MNTNIEITQREGASFIANKSTGSEFGFYSNNGYIHISANFEIQKSMMDDFVRSGILQFVEHQDNSTVFLPKTFYDSLKMTDVIVSIFEKYNL